MLQRGMLNFGVQTSGRRRAFGRAIGRVRFLLSGWSRAHPHKGKGASTRPSRRLVGRWRGWEFSKNPSARGRHHGRGKTQVHVSKAAGKLLCGLTYIATYLTNLAGADYLAVRPAVPDQDGWRRDTAGACP